MDELYTIDELAIGRTKPELRQEIEDRILAGDIVHANDADYCLGLAMKGLGWSFMRKTVSNMLDSQNPAPTVTQEAITDKVKHYAKTLANGLKVPF
jgi:hypothetical protein